MIGVGVGVGVGSFGLSSDVQDKTKVSFRIALKKRRKKNTVLSVLNGSSFNIRVK